MPFPLSFHAVALGTLCDRTTRARSRCRVPFDGVGVGCLTDETGVPPPPHHGSSFEPVARR